ncbi:MAG: cache domain-containing protein [Methanoregula sp.]|nr:cache domain-containing protein [Methanoregula sp.]
MNHRAVLFTLMVFVCLLIAATGCTQTQNGSAAATPSATTTVASAASQSPSANQTSNETLVAFVKEAVSYAKANGNAAAIAEFNKANGSFVRGELYIYAYDFNGTTLVHPVNPEKIGVNRLNETDAHGNYFIKDLRDAAQNGSGFVEFYYINPVHNRTVEKKLGYVEKVDDGWFVGSGIYEGTT